MKSAVIIIPTIGKSEFKQALYSCLSQTYTNLTIYVVIDGKENLEKVYNLTPDELDLNENVKVCILPENVGSGGWYGHRVYAAYSLLVNQDYVFYLDEDNTIQPNHVESMVSLCEKYNLAWCYSLRNIIDQVDNFICIDNCESLGKWNPFTDYNHIDTSCYCLSLDTARKFSTAIFGKWGADRNFYKVLNDYEKNYKTTGLYTLNYRLGGNEGSVKKDFFEYGNKIVAEKYKNDFPWSVNEN